MADQENNDIFPLHNQLQVPNERMDASHGYAGQPVQQASAILSPPQLQQQNVQPVQYVVCWEC